MQANDEDRLTPQNKSKSTSGIAIVAIILAVIIAGGAYYYLSGDAEPVEEVEVTEVTLPEPAPAQPIPVVDPVPEPPQVTASKPPEPVQEPAPPQPKPLPSLNDSDQYLTNQIESLTEGMNINQLLQDQDIARKFVVFVDNLSQEQLAKNASPLKGPSQGFTVTDVANKAYINPDSYHRYDVYADLVANINTEQLLHSFKQAYPIFEQAYDELGYQNSSFTDKLNLAMESLLEAPIINGPIQVNTVSVNYKFVDPNLESLPAAQKLMIRMGPENTKKIQNALHNFQNQLNQMNK